MHAQSHLERVARALRPGGIYVLGLHVVDYEVRGCIRCLHMHCFKTFFRNLQAGAGIGQPLCSCMQR